MNVYGLDMDAVSFSYPDGGKVLGGLTLRAGPGIRLGLVGANGAGKSTLLGLVAGIIEPDGGSVTIGGLLLGKRTLKEIRSRLGFVFQDPDDQLFTGSVFDDVAFGPRNLGMEEGTVRERTESALRTVGIPELSDRPPFRLSGGEKRMAAIATVLSMDPGLLVLDEPSAALDPKARRRLIGLLSSLPQTMLIATHDLDLALELCDEVAVLHAGRVAARGSAADILGDGELLDRCGLEAPLSIRACPVCGKRAAL
ncbi:MAG: cobalt ABC transporter ATP-binding protein [Spirochaetae bacterium HGW-Spirochaetae-3]|jgi:cobalt/nickel transport system ATP-binding protein|nr:MAG: cobalt ABC transporter ATP-binding protein [Spirochaetae bacterium HGW-Spirochaetae-3]